MPASHSVRALMAATAAVITVATSEINVAKAHAPDATEIALASLLDAELAFARMSLEQGIRAAFLANFAAEGIVFVPFFPLRGVESPQLSEIADRHGASPEQIALAWVLRRSPTTLPIPGTLSLEHLTENLAALEIELSADEFEAFR